jgi:hypothetical protein
LGIAAATAEFKAAAIRIDKLERAYEGDFQTVARY